jgi:hypothetical protein
MLTTTRQAITHIWESRRFKSMYSLEGKSDTHTMYASHASPCTPHVRFLWAVPVRGNISCWPNRVGRMHCSYLHLSARLSGLRDPPQFLSQHNHWSSALKPSICWWISYLSLLGPYLQHVLSTFNTCSRGPTHRSLTDTCGGYNHKGADLPHHSPRPSRLTVFHFPLMAPPGLRLTIKQFSN